MDFVSSPRRTVFEGMAFASPADRMVRIEPAPPVHRLVVRGRAGVAEAAAAALGFPLPTAVCSAAAGADVTALWLSPDEWLVLAPDTRDGTLGPALEQALAAVPHAVVDVSHRNVALTVSGPEAATILAHGCPLDLALAAFPVGMCTRTIVGKTEVVLWRTAPDAFRLEVWRSYAPYLVAFLNEARKEFEI
jgi:sarcosine oxidase subunit gamma